jgi:hypothetical protein
MMRRTLTITFVTLVIAASQVWRIHAADADVRGGWRSEIYTLKDGTRHDMPGLIVFTKSDWVVLWTITVDGKAVRGSGEGGTYTLSGNKLTFTHLFNVSGGDAVTGLAAAPLHVAANAPDRAPVEPATIRLEGDRLTIDFPSGNQILFRRSSEF